MQSSVIVGIFLFFATTEYPYRVYIYIICISYLYIYIYMCVRGYIYIYISFGCSSRLGHAFARLLIDTSRSRNWTQLSRQLVPEANPIQTKSTKTRRAASSTPAFQVAGVDHHQHAIIIAIATIIIICKRDHRVACWIKYILVSRFDTLADASGGHRQIFFCCRCDADVGVDVDVGVAANVSYAKLCGVLKTTITSATATTSVGLNQDTFRFTFAFRSFTILSYIMYI